MKDAGLESYARRTKGSRLVRMLLCTSAGILLLPKAPRTISFRRILAEYPPGRRNCNQHSVRLRQMRKRPGRAPPRPRQTISLR